MNDMPIQNVRQKVSDFHSRYEKYYNAWFFVGGFVFDVVTLDRVDNIYLIIQQVDAVGGAATHGEDIQ